jgi:hypothetical protein
MNNIVLCFVEWNFLAVVFPESLAPQGPEHIFLRELVLLLVVVFTIVTLVGVTRKILAIGTKFNQTSMAGPLGDATGCSDSGHHRS